MLFNSIEYVIFLPVVFILYWFVANKNLKFQNFLLLGISYIFYGWWDWKLLFLLICISSLNYFLGILIQKAETKKRKKLWLIVGIASNLIILSYFKYFNFFVNSFIDLFLTFGVTLQKPTLNIILPIGISFYVFISLSYIIDIYWEKIKACSNIVELSLSISFFPIILAGPIQRPLSLLPQIQKSRLFNYQQAVDGLRQILWGLFKKIVIADNAAIHANSIFNNYNSLDGSTLFLGVFYFAFQVYGDFSGYSDIAIGSARLLGFDLMRNFAYPYFSKNIAEFWRRWHISLSTWLNEYLYLPVAYSLTRKFPKKKYFGIRSDKLIYSASITITFLLCGLWHGANWTFILWGLLYAFYLIFSLITKNIRRKIKKILSLERLSFLSVLTTFILTTFGWIFFKSDNVSQALGYINRIFSMSIFSLPEMPRAFYIIILFITVEWIQRNKQYALEITNVKYTPIRWAIYYVIILLILNFGGSEQQFIYFQF